METRTLQSGEFYSAQISSEKSATGPRKCPQVGCKDNEGNNQWVVGYVYFIDAQNSSGHGKGEIIGARCKCCNGSGFLERGQEPYQAALLEERSSDFLRKIKYPAPHPVSLELLRKLKLHS
jgi:hypothetical protein